MIIGIVGSRRRNSEKDLTRLLLEIVSRKITITKIITGDCEEGGDKFARYLADYWDVEIDVKEKQLPDYYVGYWKFTQACYNRNEEIAKEDLDYLFALVAPDRTGGTENTIKYFRVWHSDWKEKLILL